MYCTFVLSLSDVGGASAQAANQRLGKRGPPLLPTHAPVQEVTRAEASVLGDPQITSVYTSEQLQRGVTYESRADERSHDRTTIPRLEQRAVRRLPEHDLGVVWRLLQQALLGEGGTCVRRRYICILVWLDYVILRTVVVCD